MKRNILVFIAVFFLCSKVAAQESSLFSYKEDYTEKTFKSGRTYRHWGLSVTPKFDSIQTAGKKQALLDGFYEHLNFIGNVDSTFMKFFSNEIWKRKLKKMQEKDNTLDLSMTFWVANTGEILHTSFYFSSRKEKPIIQEWFTEQELYELYKICKSVKYNLSVLHPWCIEIVGSKKVMYGKGYYDFVELGTSFDEIRKNMIQAGFY